MKTILAVMMAVTCAHAAPLEEGFEAIFNGKDLTGWSVKNGRAEYRVEDGAIVGTTVKGSPNTFLSTDKHYANFDLRFDVMLDDDALNSGCQIRSNSSQDYRRGQVHGYQVEIESLNGTAGFIYDEGRRGWLSKDRSGEEKRQAYKKGEWNAYRVVCVGDTLKTWVNGVLVADLEDGMTRSGFIGLQVHSVPGDPKWQVRWKNIRIKEFPNERQTMQLSDFSTEGNWKEQGDVISLVPRSGESGWKRYGSYLWAKKQYGDFVCRFEYKHGKRGNSGFYFRAADADDPVETGIEIQILDSYGKKGALSHHDNGGVIFTRGAAKNMSRKPGEWNQVKVRCEGHHLKVWLNGEKVQDMYLDKTGLKDRPMSGYLGFQDHGDPLELRRISIESL
ncbi:3-keto-disaccharide hydrolase [Rubritalea tangerina]|uniref:DUF1080 domain-containing protein n=1 Tax=Rubritalea tangerina TaxID=430798 RepID=A0ABW4ZB35_9BACT